MKKRKNLLLTIVFSSVFLLGVVQTASAIFWGKDVDSVSDWADGNCAYRTTCWTYYVFWIPVAQDCAEETIGCIY